MPRDYGYRRTLRVTIRFNRGELAILKERAKRAKQTVVEYCRQRALNDVPLENYRKENSDATSARLRDLRRG